MPCLKEIPKMKEVYKKYNEKGLTIIGISLDRVKDSWSEAIRKNNLNVWPQILSSETNEKDERRITCRTYTIVMLFHFMS